MRRFSAAFWLAIGLGIIATACSTDTPASVATRLSPTQAANDKNNDENDDDNSSSVFAVIGDVPYEPRAPQTALSLMPALISSINSDPQVTRAVHIGDIKSGSTVCSDAWFQSIAASFATFQDPLIYAIGDNEWTDCHRANNGGYNPLNRLAKLREIFFSNSGFTLGAKRHVDAQANYPENVSWKASRVVFSTFHIIGSNNGREKWFGDRRDTTSLSPLVTVPKPETAAEGASREAEYAARNAANLEWLQRTFDRATQENAKGVVLLYQADLWHPDDRAAGAVFTAHQQFVELLAKLAKEFNRPVLIVCGDSHDFRVDVGVPWFTFYGLTPVANITQLTVDRSIEADIDWVKITVDPKSAAVFSWQQMFVPVP